jgi:enoyl-CoA hydratase/carnithine racemase
VRAWRRGGIALLELHRPKVHNALDDALLTALIAELEAKRADASVRALILTGAGGSFCSGDDLKAAASASAAQFAHTISLLQSLTLLLLDLGKPVIAALNGPAYGAGLEIALNCDVRIATERFECATPEVRLGLTITNAASILLPRLIGPSRARRMLFSGARFDARWCMEAGLVDEITTSDELLERAIAVAQALSAGAPAALAATRRLLNAPWKHEIEAALRAETEVCLAAHESEGREGVRAYLSKRSPPWLAAGGSGK